MDAVPTWEWVWSVVCVLGSAFFAAATSALNTLGDLRARQLVEAGGARARLLRLWTDHPERVRATLVVGSTLSSAGAGVLAAGIAAQVSPGGRASGLVLLAAVGATAGILLVFGQLAPRVLGRRYPARTAVTCMPVVHALQWALWPAVVAVEHGAKFLSSRLEGEEQPGVTSDDLEYLIERGAREGGLDEVREELLSSVLEFADRVVREVMVPRTRMVAIDRDAPPEEILRVVTENPYSRMPVYRGSIDDVLGVLLVRELIPDLSRGRSSALPLDTHLRPPLFVPEQMKISKLLREMQRRKIHMAVVVDEFGGTAGLVTLEDVIEEIVGEIQDEADAEAAPVRPAGHGAWLAEASIPLRELEDYLNGQPGGEEHPVEFPEDGDYETLGGFVSATAGRVPPPGSRIDWDGLAFTVRAGDERRVTRIEISRRPPEEKQDGDEEPVEGLRPAAEQGT